MARIDPKDAMFCRQIASILCKLQENPDLRDKPHIKRLLADLHDEGQTGDHIDRWAHAGDRKIDGVTFRPTLVYWADFQAFCKAEGLHHGTHPAFIRELDARAWLVRTRTYFKDGDGKTRNGYRGLYTPLLEAD